MPKFCFRICLKSEDSGSGLPLCLLGVILLPTPKGLSHLTIKEHGTEEPYMEFYIKLSCR